MKPEVLLVDDDTEWLRVCSKELPQSGYTLKTSTSIESALRSLSAKPFAVVVADICMSGACDLGGFEVLDRTKALGLDTRVVMITAYAGGLKDITHKALGRGAHNFVEKKAGFQELDDCIVDAIDHWRKRHEFRKLLEEESDLESVAVQATVLLEGNIQEFTPAERKSFISALSRVVDVSPSQIHILRVAPGTVQVTLEMPREAAQLLVSMYLDGEPVLKKLGIMKVVIGEKDTALLDISRRIWSTEMQRESWQSQLAQHRWNLAKLEERAAEYGPLAVPLEVDNAIEKLKHVISELESKLSGLEGDNS